MLGAEDGARRLLRVLRRRQPRQLGRQQHPQHVAHGHEPSPRALGTRARRAECGAWPRCAGALYAARLARVPPALDDKVLTAWNGLMISAFAEGHRVLGDRRPTRGRATARPRGSCCARCGAGDGRLLRTLPRGQRRTSTPTSRTTRTSARRSSISTRRAATAATSARREALAETMRARLRRRGDGGFYSTAARGHETLDRPPARRARRRHALGANAVAAHVLARLGVPPRPRRPPRGGRAGPSAPTASRSPGSPRAFATSLMAADLLLEGPVELAFVGDAGRETAAAAARDGAAHYLPNRIVGHLDPDAAAPACRSSPARRSCDGRAALYVCRDFACQAPVTDPGRGRRPLRRAAAAPAAAERAGPAAACPAARPRRARRATPRACARAARTATRRSARPASS